MQNGARWCRKEGSAQEVNEEAVTRSWMHTKVKGQCHGHGTCHLKVYKKNFLWVFLSKRERYWPWLENPKSVSLVFLVINLMKDLIS